MIVTIEAASAAAPAVPAFALVCGWVAGSIGIVCGWPQAWKLWVRQRDAGLSLTASTMAALYTTAWLLYGVASESLVQTATGAVGLAGALLILAGHVRLSRPAARDWLPLFLTGLAVLGLMFAAGRTPLGMTASMATITGVVPQVYVLARARLRGVLDASGVSRARWTLTAACNSLWVLYGVAVGDVVIMGTAAAIFSLSVAIVVLSRQEGDASHAEGLTETVAFEAARTAA